MPNEQLGHLLGHLRRSVNPATLVDARDDLLLRQFVDDHDESAFAVLLARHGPMVWGVCRRILAPADADDAFQATFLVLFQKARSIAKQQSLASWLHGVALRVALRARSHARNRRRRESERAMRPSSSDSSDHSDLRELLDQELGRLPEKYRAPLVLCYLEGKTNDEAADLLGWTRGTVAGRMSRGRELLRRRLERRGLALASGAFAAALAQTSASAAVPPALAQSTLQSVMTSAAGGSLANPANALADGVAQSMSTKLTIALVVPFLLIIGLAAPLLLLSMSFVAYRQQATPVIISPGVPSNRGELVRENNDFAANLYAQVRGEPGNLFVSPYSVSTGLAMTYAGAKGQTADEMAKTLHFTLPPSRLHPAMGTLLRSTRSQKEGCQLHIANALWAQKGFPLQSNFLELTKTTYSSEFHEVDFTDAEAASQTVNAWANQHTEGKITELVKPALLNPKKLLLTNATYFKAQWAAPFAQELTKPATFHLGTPEDLPMPTVSIPMMNQYRNAKYHNGDDFQAAEFPYAGEELKMVVFVPKKVNGLADFEKSLTATKIEQAIANLKPVPMVSLTLPKLKLTTEVQLNDALTHMGMRQAFDVESANFSGIENSRGLFLGSIVHTAFIDINETGTEAGAVTRVEIPKGGPEDFPVFKADRPFVFVIWDNRSESILFLGRVIDPR